MTKTGSIYQILLINISLADYNCLQDIFRELAQNTQEQYQLDWVQNQEQWQQKLFVLTYDICLLDFGLNSDFIVELKHKIPEIPLIALTEDYAVGMTAIRAGATDYLDKTQLSWLTLERSLRLTLANNIKTKNITVDKQRVLKQPWEIEQFAYVAHDLQAPLHTIANYAELLKRRYSQQLDSKAHKYINYIVEGARRMKTQIEYLLEYSRLGQQKNTWREIDCNLIVRQAIANLLSEIETNEIKIICDRHLPTIVADASQLLLLLQNLIENAIKYRRQVSSIIEIRVSHQNHWWQFAVSDNGIGIEPQDWERIFQIFQRLHTPEEYPGTGIGLAICKKIVEQHGGKIWVESQLDRGSTFYFLLPDRSNSNLNSK